MALQELWELDVPRSGPAVDTEQGKKFVADFKAAMERANRSLQVTAAHAQSQQHDPLAGRRDPLVAQFQQALGKIDAADPKKAEADIKKTLDAAKALESDAAKLKQAAEQALQAWQAMQPAFDEAAEQALELQDWGSPEAAAFVQSADAIRKQADERAYADATQAVGALRAGLGPVYQAMQTQKDAQARYEPAAEALAPRLQEAGTCEFASMAELQQELVAIETQMKAAAESRDFVQAEQLLTDLAGKVDNTLVLRDDLASKKTAYEQAHAALQPRLPTTSEPGGTRVVALQDEIAAEADAMTAAAGADDYDAALQHAQSLEPKLAELETALAARDRYTAQLEALRPRLPVANTGSPTLADAESRIGSLQQQAESKAASDDYEGACADLTTLEQALAEYETTAGELEQKRQAYEQGLAALQPKLPTQSEPGGGRMAEVQDAVQQSLADAQAAADAEDYDTALQHLATLEQRLAELDTLLTARADYEARLAGIEPRLPATQEPAAGRLAEVQDQLAQLRSDAEAAAADADYEAALQALGEVDALLTEYEQLSDLKQQFDERWADLRARLPDATEPGASPEVVALNESIVQTRSGLESKAAQGDYEGALCDVDELVRLASDLEAAEEMTERLRAEFEQEYATIAHVVDLAVGTPTEVAAVKEKQDEVVARKAELDAAVAQNDYETAQQLIADVDGAVQAYEEELRKEPRNCDWLNATAIKLTAGIMRHYLQAQSKIDRAAQAYDDALEAHKAAIEAVDSKKQLVADVVAGIFFAGLGGAAGGAVGGALKSSVEGAFKAAAQSGAILDATKDIAKFTARTFTQMAADAMAGDPTSVSVTLGDSGVELARTVGQAVNDQGVALLAEVEKLAQMVRDKPEACDNGEGVRVEGDPAAVLDSDPFLKVLGTIASADRRTFAQLLWGEWINQHAYSIEERCDLVDPGFSSQTECYEYVESNVDGLFAWWGDLIKNIEAQTGSDFKLRERLDAAKARMWKLAEAY